MGNQPDEKFTWVIKNFSSLQSKKIHSNQFVYGSCKWRLLAYPKGDDKENHFSLYLAVADSEILPIGWRIHAKVSLTILNQSSDKLSQRKEGRLWFDKEKHCAGQNMITLTELNDREGFLVNGELIIVVKIDVLEVVGQLEEYSLAMETINVFQVLPSKTNRETFLGGFSKILEQQWQSDVRLRAMDSDEGAYISAHKLVLAARSKVFRLMFESDEFKALAKLETVTLSEMKHEEVEALVEFIYSDGSTLSAKAKQNVRPLFIAAHKYEILHLRDLCRNELISSLHLKNVLDVYKLSLIPYERDLEGAALVFIVRNFKIIANSKEFELFGNNNPDLTVKIVKEVVKEYC